MGAGAIGIGAAGLGVIGNFLGADQEARAARQQAEFNAQQAMFNAKMAQYEAGEIRERGEYEMTRYGKDVARLKGAQRVAGAAQGIDITTGSAAEIMAATSKMAGEDISMIKTNAWRMALGKEFEASQYKKMAQMYRQGAAAASRGTLLTAGLRGAASLGTAVADYWGK